MTGMSFIESLRKGLDRAGFEADKLMRYNRVRSEAVRLNQQANEQLRALGEQALGLYKAGKLTAPELRSLAGEIGELQERAHQKEAEAAAVQSEAWVEPADPAPSAAPPTAATGSVTTPPHAAPAPPRRLEDQETHRVPAAAALEFCPQCGAPLRPNALFCAQCGTRL